MSKQNIDERRQNRNLVGATVNAPGAELANSSHSHECLVEPHLQAPNQTGAATEEATELDLNLDHCVRQRKATKASNKHATPGDSSQAAAAIAAVPTPCDARLQDCAAVPSSSSE